MSGGGADRRRDGATALADLADRLRVAGVPVATGQLLAYARALDGVAAEDVAERYWRGRACLVSDPAHLAIFDRVFAAEVAGAPAAPGVGPADAASPPVTGGIDAASDRGGAGRADEPDRVDAGGVATARERLRHRRFDRADEQERAAIAALLDRLPVALPTRVTRRRVAGAGTELDLAGTLELASRTDHELLELATLRRRRRPRRLVVLLDVSGSMAAHARALLRFAGAARRAVRPGDGPQVEVFAFGTRLTRLTDALDARDPDAAIDAAAREVVDWDGGTRIAASLDTLLRTWGRRGVLRGAVVVICSDGLERGDPAALGRVVARLRRSVHRLVWVNPLAGDPRYEPAQRGMAAALPAVDVFLPGHDLASVEHLAEVLAALR